uniref:Myosin, light polypeptide 6, alkali, smooth muscle and non-muscle n=1 Tax=Mus musculus TaxID=10090 RepID=A0A1W2P8F0_MOUSE
MCDFTEDQTAGAKLEQVLSHPVLIPSSGRPCVPYRHVLRTCVTSLV